MAYTGKIGSVGTIGKVKIIGRAPYSQVVGPPQPGKRAVKPLAPALARALHKAMQTGDECPNVVSSAVSSIGYDNSLGRLSVTFKRSGRTYNYFDVSQQQYDKFCAADSKGRFFNKAIRDKYAYTRQG